MIQCLYKNSHSNAYIYYNYIENGFIDYYIIKIYVLFYSKSKKYN